MDGLIIPDLPLEEQEELQTQLQKEDGTILIQLVSPVSKDRVPKILKMHGICLLCVFHGSYRTGSNLPPSDFRISDSGKERGKIPVMMGFGIRTAEDVRPMKEIMTEPL